MEKQCFKCGQMKPLQDFYRHPRMADGFLNKCKRCAKTDVNSNRKKCIDYYRDYDRRRFQEQPQRKIKVALISARWRKENPEKYRAHCILANAVRDGKIKRQPCRVCGNENVHAHHREKHKELKNIQAGCN